MPTVRWLLVQFAVWFGVGVLMYIGCNHDLSGQVNRQQPCLPSMHHLCERHDALKCK